MKPLASCLLFTAFVVCAVGEQTKEEKKLQEQVYIISGVFGGVTLVLCLMILGLAYSITKLGKQVTEAKTSKQQSRPNPVSINRERPENNPPNFNVPPPNSYNAGTEEPRRKPMEDIALEPVHHQRDEYADNYSRGGHGGGYPYRGEDRADNRDRGQADRSSQYSWEPIPRSGGHGGRGDDGRGQRYNYRR